MAPFFNLREHYPIYRRIGSAIGLNYTNQRRTALGIFHYLRIMRRLGSAVMIKGKFQLTPINWNIGETHPGHFLRKKDW